MSEINAIATNNYLLATPIGSGYMETSALEYDGDKISGYAGSAFKAGDEFPQSATDAIGYVTATSANIDSTIDNVSSNSGAWGGSALPISAGPGIKFSMVDNTLVASTDETVLWSGAGTTACTLSESPSAFDRIRFYGYRNEGSLANSMGVFEFPTEGMTGYDLSQLLYNNEDTYRALYLSRYAITGTSCTLEKAQHLYAATGATNWSGPGTVAIVLYKIVGINRIAGGN